MYWEDDQECRGPGASSMLGCVMDLCASRSIGATEGYWGQQGCRAARGQGRCRGIGSGRGTGAMEASRGCRCIGLSGAVGTSECIRGFIGVLGVHLEADRECRDSGASRVLGGVKNLGVSRV